MTPDNTLTYGYDPRSNLTLAADDDSRVTFTYDNRNRVATTTTDDTVGPQPQVTLTYSYDLLDRRTRMEDSLGVVAFVYDPWNPYATTANDAVLDFENGTLAKRWLHGTRTDEPLAFEGYTGTTAAGSGSAYGLFANRLGSILTAVSISTGAVAADYDYDAFGTQTQTVNTIEQRYGYTGREQDYETGLIYYRARHYDPATGQFIQRDPIGFAAGDLNLYAYTFNDPYNWTDPSGLTPSVSYARLTGAVVGGGLLVGILNALQDALQNIDFGSPVFDKANENEANSKNDGT
ncbi:RHS repeat-associated core domain-containing protein [Ruegeria halocynthiae]|uniref:RHS repeat-associated core domain-containing protein n=1 Tax=Ruegeria halocynthiae TaxID=985054 RepID=UPI00136339AD|nr:RHS repeat-associated core domain-containing protein [Ruegeria halocynthiae]